MDVEAFIREWVKTEIKEDADPIEPTVKDVQDKLDTCLIDAKQSGITAERFEEAVRNGWGDREGLHLYFKKSITEAGAEAASLEAFRDNER